MQTSEALAALFDDRMQHGDVVLSGGFVDRDRAWVRVALLRRFVEHTTPQDDPRDVADAAHELAEIVGALLAEEAPVRRVA